MKIKVSKRFKKLLEISKGQKIEAIDEAIKKVEEHAEIYLLSSFMVEYQ